MDIDSYIRVRLHRSYTHESITPSRDFTRRVMARVMKKEQRRTWAAGVGIACLGFLPLFARLGWTILRQDYFAVGTWPLASAISAAYHFFMSPTMLYALGIAGSAVVLFFIWFPQWRTRGAISHVRSKFS